MSERTDITNNTHRNAYARYFDIDMSYQKIRHHGLRGKRKRELAILLAARIGFVSAIVCSEMWQISRAKTLECLNKLVAEGLLDIAKTIRAADGRIYVLTYSGAKYASELMQIVLPFRSSSQPILQVNQNAIMHDCILSFVLTSGLLNRTADGKFKPLWNAFITEPEFKRMFPSNAVKNVDALVLLEDNSVAAIEIEHSFKRKEQHEKTLLKLRDAMLSAEPLYDKVFIIVCSEQIHQDTKRFYEQLFKELATRKNKKTNNPLLQTNEVEYLTENIIFRTKFIKQIDRLFYA